MGFLSIYRKSQNVSVIPLNGIISPNMGRRKGLNLNEIDKNIEDAFSVKNLKAVAISEILTVDYDLNGNVIDNKKNIIKKCPKALSIPWPAKTTVFPTAPP